MYTALTDRLLDLQRRALVFTPHWTFSVFVVLNPGTEMHLIGIWGHEDGTNMNRKSSTKSQRPGEKGISKRGIWEPCRYSFTHCDI